MTDWKIWGNVGRGKRTCCQKLWTHTRGILCFERKTEGRKKFAYSAVINLHLQCEHWLTHNLLLGPSCLCKEIYTFTPYGCLEVVSFVSPCEFTAEKIQLRKINDKFICLSVRSNEVCCNAYTWSLNYGAEVQHLWISDCKACSLSFVNKSKSCGKFAVHCRLDDISTGSVFSQIHVSVCNSRRTLSLLARMKVTTVVETA